VSAEARQIEVTAWVVGSYVEPAAWAELAPLGLFALGTDENGSRVYRLVVEAQDDRTACSAVLEALLRVDGLVPHDIRAGAYQEISGADEEARLLGFLARLSPSVQQEVKSRLAEVSDRSS
jgi:hypothetical protein